MRSASGPDGDGECSRHHYATLWMFALLSGSCARRERARVGAHGGAGWAARRAGRFVRSDGAGGGGRRASGVRLRRVVREGGRPPARRCWSVVVEHLDAATGYVVYRLVQEIVARLGGHWTEDEGGGRGTGRGRGRWQGRKIGCWSVRSTSTGPSAAARGGVDAQ